MSEPTVHHTVEVTGDGPVTLGIIEALRKHAPADARLSIREAQDAYGVTLTWTAPLQEQSTSWSSPFPHKPGCRCSQHGLHQGGPRPRSAGQEQWTAEQRARQEAADTQRAEYVAHLEAEHEEIRKGRPWTFNPGNIERRDEIMDAIRMEGEDTSNIDPREHRQSAQERHEALAATVKRTARERAQDRLEQDTAAARAHQARTATLGIKPLRDAQGGLIATADD